MKAPCKRHGTAGSAKEAATLLRTELEGVGEWANKEVEEEEDDKKRHRGGQEQREWDEIPARRDTVGLPEAEEGPQ